MAQRKSSGRQSEPPGPPSLTISRAEAEAKIRDRIEKGRAIRDQAIDEREQLDAMRADYYKWTEYNSELLTRLFTTSAPANDYRDIIAAGSSVGRQEHWSVEVPRLQASVDSKIRRLESLLERLELFPEPPAIAGAVRGAQRRSAVNREVFVVHGHDNTRKLQAARVIDKLGLNPIILAEQPNQGRTLIEKFEQHSDVGFAVVILSADDVGKAKADADLKPRARQNVIFELGYFMGTLKRAKVCALYAPGVELPTDILGVAWVGMDDGGAWEWTLAKEMKAAGLPADLNKLA